MGEYGFLIPSRAYERRCRKGIGVLLICIASVLALAGCGSLRSPAANSAAKPGAERPGADAIAMLHYFDTLRGLSGVELEQEQDRQRKAYIKDKSDVRRIQYAMAMSVPSASIADRRLALAALEPMMKETKGHDPDLRLLALLLFSEQRRSDELEKKLEALKDIERSLLQRDQGAAPGVKP